MTTNKDSTGSSTLQDQPKSTNESNNKSLETNLNQNTTALPISKDISNNANLTNNGTSVSINQEVLPKNTTTNENNRDNITLSGKDATSFFDSISQAGIRNEGADGDTTVVRIEINRQDFENIRQRPNAMKEFKSILKKAIDGKHRHDMTKPSQNRNNDLLQSKKSNDNKVVERQKLILAKKTAALSRMAQLASKNLDEIKRLEKEAFRQQMLLNKQGSSQLSSFRKKESSSPLKIFETLANTNNEIKSFDNQPQLSNTSLVDKNINNKDEISEIFIKPSLRVTQQRNITQSSLGTGAMVPVCLLYTSPSPRDRG